MEQQPTPEQIAAVEHRVDTGENYYTAWMLETGSIPVIEDGPEDFSPSVGAPRDPHSEETWTPNKVLDTMPDLSSVRSPYKD